MTISTSAASPISGLESGIGYGTAADRVHPLARVSGSVQLQGDVAIAQGATVQAEGNCLVGAGSLLQEGASIYALTPGKVLGDDRQPYTVWVGERVTLTYKVLVQGPAYLGSNSFIGFRSTIFNARLGQGCVVMMHALIQDVDVPAGKLVPSGSIITRQAQADALPDVTPADLALVREIMGHGHLPTSLTDSLSQSPSRPELHERDGLGTMQSQLTPDIVQQVRQYLAQGLRIGTEYADLRRYRSGVWQTCSPIQSSREPEALAALEACLSEHAGEYVRMFGIDPRAKQRVAPVTIQRPDGKPMELNGRLSAVTPVPSQAYQPTGPMATTGTLAPEIVQQVRQYLSQGYRIGTEHADSRRYRSGVWQTCSPIVSNREGEVLAALEGCLVEHAGEYIRMFGIDSRANQRIASVTIQRPDGEPRFSQSGSRTH
ncbi:MAG: carbon dioxide-concentrating mechanism protein CcmM [Leptolyngbyaceae cyanobacterium SM2_5_2]|nr:carbon dioxide-concentrating mechanism protein CcmM [Leptolyngbyaceae cyanobacterium SM2_5_2]